MVEWRLWRCKCCLLCLISMSGGGVQTRAHPGTGEQKSKQLIRFPFKILSNRPAQTWPTLGVMSGRMLWQHGHLSFYWIVLSARGVSSPETDALWDSGRRVYCLYPLLTTTGLTPYIITGIRDCVEHLKARITLFPSVLEKKMLNCSK